MYLRDFFYLLFLLSIYEFLFLLNYIFLCFLRNILRKISGLPLKDTKFLVTIFTTTDILTNNEQSNMTFR